MIEGYPVMKEIKAIIQPFMLSKGESCSNEF